MRGGRAEFLINGVASGSIMIISSVENKSRWAALEMKRQVHRGWLQCREISAYLGSVAKVNKRRNMLASAVSRRRQSGGIGNSESGGNWRSKK